MLTRRAFLAGAAAGSTALGAGGLLVGCTSEDSPVAAPNAVESFRGLRAGALQTGILAAGSAYGLLASFRTVAEDSAELGDTMRAVSEQIEVLGAGQRPEPLDAGLPPPDNGVLDDAPARLNSATLSVGASLFDERFGLASRKPVELVGMTRLANDRLDPTRTHGDMLLVLQASHPDVCVHALRRIMRATRGTLVLHWLLDTFTRPDEQPLGGQTKTRNLMGFKDGTANPDAAQDDVMDEVVWVRAVTASRTGRPAALIRRCASSGCSSSTGTVRRCGSRKRSSAGTAAAGRRWAATRRPTSPITSPMPMVRRSRSMPISVSPTPRDGSPALMLRRGFSYARGVDGSGQLDQGLAFISYQRRLDTFLQTQQRLAGEPLEEYIVPEGGGFFFALPGPGPDGWLGQSLLAG